MRWPASERPTSPPPNDGAPGWRWQPNNDKRWSSDGGWWERPQTANEIAREPEERRKDAAFVAAMLRGELRHVGNGNHE